MYKIGIIGSDNTHALGVAKLCNIPDENGNYKYDARVTAIYGRGDDPAHTKEVAEAGHIEKIIDDPKELFGTVDAVMTVCRSGSLHVGDILPFVEAGIPCWIDKPICTTEEDAIRLIEAQKKSGALITGGSNVKFCYDILALQSQMKSGGLGTILGGTMNFAGDMASQYDGLFFYGSHIVEMMLELYGYEPKSLVASAVKSDRLSVIVNYEDVQVTLNFVAEWSHYFITVYGTDRSKTVEMDISAATALGVDNMMRMLNEKKMPISLHKLLKPIEIIDAIERSVKEGKEIELGTWKI